MAQALQVAKFNNRILMGSVYVEKSRGDTVSWLATGLQAANTVYYTGVYGTKN